MEGAFFAIDAVFHRAPKAFGVYVATPLGFEPRITPPKGAVLPLHHGVCGLAILDWLFSIQAQCPKLERDRVYAKQLAAKIDVESVAAAASMMTWPQPTGPWVMERTIYLQHY